MLRCLPLILAFSVAPWTEAPAPLPSASPAPQPVIRKAPEVSPSTTTSRSSQRPARRGGSLARRKDAHRRLAQLLARERSIWNGILKKKTPAAFHDLAAVRLAIANEERRLKLITPAQYRRYLLKKAVLPAKLNLREWGHRARDARGVPHDAKSWALLGKIVNAVKATVKNPPLARGEKLAKGRATHYGGERAFDASSYPEFHAKPTSVGDTFCMYGQTCAYMRAPLNSWVRVRHLRSGRFVDVRVNDTGPFESFGVLVDLSRGAYHLLGLRDGDRVVIRRISSAAVIPEPTLCSGRGHAARSPGHLKEKHSYIPPAWKKKN